MRPAAAGTCRVAPRVPCPGHPSGTRPGPRIPCNTPVLPTLCWVPACKLGWEEGCPPVPPACPCPPPRAHLCMTLPFWKAPKPSR